VPTFTTVFEQENFLRFPDILPGIWGIDDEDLYAETRGGEIFLRKKRAKNTVAILGVSPGFGVSLPPLLVKAAGLCFGHEVELTLEDDVLRLHNTKKIAFDSPAVKRAVLEVKLQKELAKAANSSEVSLLTDIYHILIYHEWEIEVLDGLLRVPNPLQTVADALGDDEAFAEFYEDRVRHLTLQCVVDSVFTRTKMKRLDEVATAVKVLPEVQGAVLGRQAEIADIFHIVQEKST